ncbi:MAG TPA: LysE family transporter [Streptosporangiaceae bacterium]|jgi:threonine/homoserine/homoserine lactone efflux protein
MAVSSIAAFWAVAILLIAVPGADWAFVIGTALGGRSVPLAVGGLALGYTGMTAVVAAGAGAIMAHSRPALTTLTIAGGLYLIYLGARTLTHSGARALPATPADIPASQADVPATRADASATRAADPSGGAGAQRGTLVRGIGVSGLNPKGLLLFLALLPQFASPRADWPLAGQLALLGVVFTLSCAGFYLTLGSLAGRLLHARPGAALTVTRISGAAMIIIGTALLAERLIT